MPKKEEQKDNMNANYNKRKIHQNMKINNTEKEIYVNHIGNRKMKWQKMGRKRN